MKINIETDCPIPLAEIASQLPRRGSRPVHVATLHRWRTKGLKGGIRLECVRIGNVWCTSWKAVQVFADRCTAAQIDHMPHGDGATSKSAEAADEQLEDRKW